VTAQVVLFAAPHDVVVVPRTAAELGDAVSRLPDTAPETERLRILSSLAQDAAGTGATVVLVWPPGAPPFGLWIQITPISGLELARAFVRSEADGWIGPLHAPLVGAGLEWFAAVSDHAADRRWSAAFADDELFVNLTLHAPSPAGLVARRALVESMVLPFLVIAEDAEPWSGDERLAAGLVVPAEPWPQLTSARATP